MSLRRSRRRSKHRSTDRTRCHWLVCSRLPHRTACSQDYVAARIKKGLRPITFRVIGVRRVENPVCHRVDDACSLLPLFEQTLQRRFELARGYLTKTRTQAETKIKIGFHGVQLLLRFTSELSSNRHAAGDC